MLFQSLGKAVATAQYCRGMCCGTLATASSERGMEIRILTSFATRPTDWPLWRWELLPVVRELEYLIITV